MASLTICPEAERELDELYDVCEADAALIDVLIEELSGDESALASLCEDVPKWNYFHQPPYEVKRFGECWKVDRRVYTLKVYDENGHLCDRRVIVAHDPLSDEYCVLATPHRDFDYDPASHEFADILERYDRAGFDSIR